jgi:hypothetical protein
MRTFRQIMGVFRTANSVILVALEVVWVLALIMGGLYMSQFKPPARHWFLAPPIEKLMVYGMLALTGTRILFGFLSRRRAPISFMSPLSMSSIETGQRNYRKVGAWFWLFNIPILALILCYSWLIMPRWSLRSVSPNEQWEVFYMPDRSLLNREALLVWREPGGVNARTGAYLGRLKEHYKPYHLKWSEPDGKVAGLQMIHRADGEIHFAAIIDFSFPQDPFEFDINSSLNEPVTPEELKEYFHSNAYRRDEIRASKGIGIR